MAALSLSRLATPTAMASSQPPNAGSPAPDAAAARARQSGRFASFVAAGILISRLTGLLREIVLRSFFGLGTKNGIADAFEAALRIPKLLQNLLGEGALSASFVPVYASLLDEDREEANRVAGSVFGLLTAAVAAVVLLVVVGARWLVRLIAFGFPPDSPKFELAVELTRVMAPGIGFIVLAAWCLGVLNSHRQFFLSYVAPALWNIAIIAAIVILATTDDPESVARSAAIGVFIGGVLQFVVQLPAVLRVVDKFRPSFAMRPAVREITSRFGPAVAGRGVVTLASFVDIALASFLASGALAALSAAQVLYLLPISVFAMSVAAADLPELAREQSSIDISRARIYTGADRIVFFLMFSAVAFVTMGGLIVGAAFERGKFSSDDTLVVWIILAAYSLGLVAAGLSRLLQNAAFAAGDVKGPARIALYRVIFAVIVGVVLMLQFDRIGVLNGGWFSFGDLPAFGPVDADLRSSSDANRLGALGLAVGSMLGAWVELSLLQQRVAKAYGSMSFRRTVGRLWPAAAAAAVLGLLATVLLGGLPALIAAPVALAISGSVYVLLANKFGNPTSAELLTPIRRRLWS